MHGRRMRNRRLAITVAAVVGAAMAPAGADAAGPAPDVRVSTSQVRGTDGKTYTLTNHVAGYADPAGPHEWLLAWAGSTGTGTGTASSAPAPTLPGESRRPQEPVPAAAAAPDFLAVIDASPGSATYGKVVNTATLDQLTGIEPHHMQYLWHKGDRVYAGGIIGDVTLTFDTAQLPRLRIAGVGLPTDTPCGTAPDAYWVLKDGTAYGTYMGGPNVTGPCTYTDGQVRYGNGAAGTPGEIVHFGRDGRVLGEFPAASGEPEAGCPAVPAIPVPSCANPHGVQAREDLGRMVSSDYTEIRDLLNGQFGNAGLLRDTVRTWDISDRDHPKVASVSTLPAGPRPNEAETFRENRMAMETSVTSRPRHKGAFVSTMLGGAVYYTPDITATAPKWQEVFDDTAAYRAFGATAPGGGGDGASWLQVSPDDHYLFHAVMGSDNRLPRDQQTGMVYVLDISRLVAGGHPACTVDQLSEVERGGSEPDCPKLTGVVPIRDAVSPGVNVGPHWGALDNLTPGPGGKFSETGQVSRFAVADYFVARLDIDGDHRVCMVDLKPGGATGLDRTFKDENTAQPCVNFNREGWPHGATGPARPHGVLFVAADRDVR
jgi:hypothetical protein